VQTKNYFGSNSNRERREQPDEMVVVKATGFWVLSRESVIPFTTDGNSSLGWLVAQQINVHLIY
jgi:hypothetical protein